MIPPVIQTIIIAAKIIQMSQIPGSHFNGIPLAARTDKLIDYSRLKASTAKKGDPGSRDTETAFVIIPWSGLRHRPLVPVSLLWGHRPGWSVY